MTVVPVASRPGSAARADYTAGVPLIVTENLTKRYPGPGGGVLALDALTVEIEPGIVGLVGANGAGKSTFLRILLGLLAPTSGKASVLGLDTATRGGRIRERVGYMPEHDVLPPDLTATDLVAHLAEMSGLPRTAARERTADVLRHVGLFEERYRPIGGYSTGMRQRVKLAQALVHDPRLLLLDEPTNGLDPTGRDEMLDLIRRTGNEFGIAVLVCSHLLGEIERVCDHVVAIDGGRLLRSASLASFTGRTGTLIVEVDEGADDLAADLVAAGFRARVDGPRFVLVVTQEVGPYDAIRDAAATRGLALIRIEAARHRVEDLFRDEPGADGVHGTAA
jgi:ABC-2 type transport system ATP-binding protein